MVTPTFKPFVMPMAVVILLGLFAAQRFGTEKIGRAFGPVMLLWFIVIAALGLAAIAHHPGVVVALDPRYAIRFMVHARGEGLLVLGGVFLCITGGEALYADMGHFGKGPIRRSWYGVVLPSLLLSYAGQTAFLIDKGTVTGNPFFQMAPSWSIYPLVVLATLATIIASQAIVTGSFSMTRQAMQLGWLPGVAIRQTSDRIYGQIYVPVVNWLLMTATIATTIAFGSSDRLAGAYGTAVSTTMLLTTVLLVSGHARRMALVLRRRRRGRGYLSHRGWGLLRCQSLEDSRRWLAALELRGRIVRRHDYMAIRHRRDTRGADAAAASRGALFVRS